MILCSKQRSLPPLKGNPLITSVTYIGKSREKMAGIVCVWQASREDGWWVNMCWDSTSWKLLLKLVNITIRWHTQVGCQVMCTGYRALAINHRHVENFDHRCVIIFEASHLSYYFVKQTSILLYQTWRHLMNLYYHHYQSSCVSC